MTTIISAEGLGKKYLISHQPKERYTALRDVLAARARRLSKAILRPFAGTSTAAAVTKEEFWALRDVNFEIREGDRVGIIGRNGAGKSTLLKILSRITEPSTGRVKIKGRMASLLEVGTGFHPELTGRENIFLNGAILGMSKSEITRKFDEIVAFAEIERFLDTPVKRYSSGMYVRLAFAVAAHLEPDILIVDEVLAVGDAQFQKKCLGKMEEVGKGGRTVLFVSHNMAAIKTLCDTAILLSGGLVSHIGSVQEVIDRYAIDSEGGTFSLPLVAGDVIINSFEVNQNGYSTDSIDGTSGFGVVIGFEVKKDLKDFRIGIYVEAATGEAIMRSFIGDWDSSREEIGNGRYEARLDVPGRFFAPGMYNVRLHASRFGVVDYLSTFQLRKQIHMSLPTGFNQGHLNEELNIYVLSKNNWELCKLEN